MSFCTFIACAFVAGLSIDKKIKANPDAVHQTGFKSGEYYESRKGVGEKNPP